MSTIGESCPHKELCGHYLSKCEKCTVVDINDVGAKRVNWTCSLNANPDWHYGKDDKVVLVDDLAFDRDHFMSSRHETMFVPKGTKGYVVKTWRHDNGYCFVNIITENGVRLRNIPYNALEWEDNEEKTGGAGI